MRTRAKKGLFKGSNPPYGYEVQEGKLYVKDDNTPNIVRRIFEEYLAGNGRDSIARRLYNEGIPTPAEIAGKKNAGDKWNDSTIKLILINPHYAGDLVQNRTTTVSVTSKKRKKVDLEKQIIIKGTHEAIIPSEVFNTVQQQMKIRTKFITAPKKHLFTNVLFCADCGKGMWYRSNRKGYICGNYARYDKKAWSSHCIEEDILKDTILTDIQDFVKQIDKEQYLKQLEAQTKKSKQNLRKQLGKLEKQISRKRKYINMLAEEIISHVDYRENVEANNIEMAELVEKKNELLTAIESEQRVDNLEQLKQELLQFLDFDELTPEILHRLVNRIEVKVDGIPKIHYQFSAPKIV
ncbi:recombinase family protein [Neobacillus niacini]|uniref:recombinase family protein n=1 Tax=Neobacillus niacini TaxID=86668 RepID=UPI0030014D5D